MHAPILYLAEVLWMCRMNSPTKLCIRFAPLVQLRFRHWSLLHPASARRHLRRLGLRGVTTIEIQDSIPKPIKDAIRMSWSECHRHEWPNGHTYTHLYSYVYMCILLYISRFVDANMLIVSLYHDQNTGIPGVFPLCVNYIWIFRTSPVSKISKFHKIPGFPWGSSQLLRRDPWSWISANLCWIDGKWPQPELTNIVAKYSDVSQKSNSFSDFLKKIFVLVCGISWTYPKKFLSELGR